MQATAFWKAFQSAMRKNIDSAKKAWPYNKDYTDFIVKMLEEMLGKEGEGYEISREYYRIDLTAWVQKRQRVAAQVPTNAAYRFQPYLWDLEIAVEHENNDKLWMDEVIKLAHICCALRVVIGYVPSGVQKTPYLAYVADAIAGSLNENARKNMENGAFLLILGNSKAEEKERCVYTPYIWKNGAFTPLQI